MTTPETQPAKFEIWKSIHGWPYEASSLGRIRRSVGGKGTRVGKILNQNLGGPVGYQYLYVSLCAEGKIIKRRVHILVAEAFLENRPSKKIEVNHKDGNKLNNMIKNLEYATKKENVTHAKALGLMACGEKNGAAKLSLDDVLEIRKLRQQGVPRQKVADRFGLHPMHVSQITSRKRWAHV